MGPAVVCYAFSLEVFVKFLLITEPPKKEFTDAHDLEALYNNLPSVLRSKVEAKLVAGKIDLELEKVAFGNNLRTFAKAFVEWRYQYEGNAKPVSLDFVRRLLEALENLAA
jgi:hypothetical protein